MKMSEKLYACIISSADVEQLKEIADRFAYRIQMLEDGILFEIGGLRKIFGEPHEISKLIRISMEESGIKGNIAIAENPQTAIIQARNVVGETVNKSLNDIALNKIGLTPDTFFVLDSLGLKKVKDLKRIPEADLIARYGPEVCRIVETINNRGRFVLTPNFKENHVSWSFPLDFPVLNLEQLIFLIRHGLEKIFLETAKFGLSSERVKIILNLEDKTVKEYEMKISFPTLEVKFWLKIINLKISKDAPESGILSLELRAYFVRPRSIQNGLFSASAPQPESLLLTVLKIKKLVGNENVGVPIIINQRLLHNFGIDPEKMPKNNVCSKVADSLPVISFSHFQPPLEAEVMVSNRKLIYLKTKKFKGKVKDYGGNWINSGQWWDESEWLAEEWDVELEEGGLYRLARNKGKWFVLGEYD